MKEKSTNLTSIKLPSLKNDQLNSIPFIDKYIQKDDLSIFSKKSKSIDSVRLNDALNNEILPAIAIGNAEAAFVYSLILRSGLDGIVQDDSKWFDLLQYAAEHGIATAQNDLGDCYYNGTGVEPDYSKAVEWYTKAATQGLIKAQASLGDCYYNGTGVEQDYSKAVEWYSMVKEENLDYLISFANAQLRIDYLADDDYFRNEIEHLRNDLLCEIRESGPMQEFKFKACASELWKDVLTGGGEDAVIDEYFIMSVWNEMCDDMGYQCLELHYLSHSEPHLCHFLNESSTSSIFLVWPPENDCLFDIKVFTLWYHFRGYDPDYYDEYLLSYFYAAIHSGSSAIKDFSDDDLYKLYSCCSKEHDWYLSDDNWDEIIQIMADSYPEYL